MKIYTFVDWSTPCIYGTMGWGIEGLADYINDVEIIAYSYDQLKSREFDGDSNNNTILVFEIGNPQHSNWTTEQLREKFPNAKFVALCSDTIYYQMNGLSFQMDPSGIDLHLEVMPQSVKWFREKNIAAEFFRWGISDKLINKALAYYTGKFLNNGGKHPTKDIDFIGVYHPGTISNPDCWRYHAVKYLEENGYTFTQGGGSGHQDNDLERLFSYYLRSKFTLGTTSHNRKELTRLGCMKFFRDELGPLLHSMLIYDTHLNVTLRYNYNGTVVPQYDYDDFRGITYLVNSIPEKDRNEYINKQIHFVCDHSFEKEFLRCCVKHNIINKELISATL